MEEDIEMLKEFAHDLLQDYIYSPDEVPECDKKLSKAIENLIEGYKEHRNALIDMVDQFADTDKEEKHLYTMGLSALENAFNVLDIDEGIKREDLWKLQEGDK